MRLVEIDPDHRPVTAESFITQYGCPGLDYRNGPMPETPETRKLEKMMKEIERDHKERHIHVPIHMRNEYYDDSFEDGSELDWKTEMELLDIELEKLTGKRRVPLQLPPKRGKNRGFKRV